MRHEHVPLLWADGQVVDDHGGHPSTDVIWPDVSWGWGVSRRAGHAHLFRITTPINVDCFQSLLSSHPNQPFVLSVCRGLREGFWPFANTHYGEWPLTWDNSKCTPKTPEGALFL